MKNKRIGMNERPHAGMLSLRRCRCRKRNKKKKKKSESNLATNTTIHLLARTGGLG